jgi:hypothetical protein
MPDPFRVLLIATEPHVEAAVEEELRAHAGDRPVQTMVVLPAVADSRFEQVTGDVDDAIKRTSAERDDVRREVEATGSEVYTEPRIGDSDPLLAIEDGLREFPADAILIVTRPGDEAGWMEDDLFDRARERFEQPISHFVIRDDDGQPEVLESESAEPQGTSATQEEESPSRSRNMPRYSRRDIAGIVVALFGTLALAILATDCGSYSSDSGINSCAVTLMIAGAVALANIAHVVALMLFQTVGGEGFWRKMLSGLSLYGTLAGLVAALLIHA